MLASFCRIIFPSNFIALFFSWKTCRAAVIIFFGNNRRRETSSLATFKREGKKMHEMNLNRRTQTHVIPSVRSVAINCIIVYYKFLWGLRLQHFFARCALKGERIWRESLWGIVARCSWNLMHSEHKTVLPKYQWSFVKVLLKKIHVNQRYCVRFLLWRKKTLSSFVHFEKSYVIVSNPKIIRQSSKNLVEWVLVF